MDPADRALDRLRDPEHGALQSLARLVVEEAARTPLAEIARPRWLAGQLAAGLEAVAREPTLRDALAHRVEQTLGEWRDDPRPLGTFLPDEVEIPLRDALRRPWVPREDLVLRVLDHGLVVEVTREVLENTLKRFRKRLSNLDQGLFAGLGGRAARRGRGLLGGVASGMAGTVVGAVREEFEARIDVLIQEFLAGATREAIAGVARHAADPDHAEAYGELRVSFLDVLQETELGELAHDLDQLGVLAYLDIGLAAVRAALDEEDFVDRTEARIASLLEEVGEGTLGAWLEEVGLLEVWTASTVELLAERLRAVVVTEDFEGWWRDLFA